MRHHSLDTAVRKPRTGGIIVVVLAVYIEASARRAIRGVGHVVIGTAEAMQKIPYDLLSGSRVTAIALIPIAIPDQINIGRPHDGSAMVRDIRCDHSSGTDCRRTIISVGSMWNDFRRS